MQRTALLVAVEDFPRLILRENERKGSWKGVVTHQRESGGSVNPPH